MKFRVVVLVKIWFRVVSVNNDVLCEEKTVVCMCGERVLKMNSEFFKIFQKLKIIPKAFSLTPFKKTAVAQELIETLNINWIRVEVCLLETKKRHDKKRRTATQKSLANFVR